MEGQRKHHKGEYYRSMRSIHCRERFEKVFRVVLIVLRIAAVAAVIVLNKFM